MWYDTCPRLKAPCARSAPWREKAIRDLSGYIKEILDGAIGSDRDGGLLRNYLQLGDGDALGYGEISGSSMLAAVTYRMAVLRPSVFGRAYVEFAESIREVLGSDDEDGNPHVTDEGIVTPAVNPLWWGDPKPFTSGSPEGQGFVVLLYAAWRDCILARICEEEDADGLESLVRKRSVHQRYRRGHQVLR